MPAALGTLSGHSAPLTTAMSFLSFSRAISHFCRVFRGQLWGEAKCMTLQARGRMSWQLSHADPNHYPSGIPWMEPADQPFPYPESKVGGPTPGAAWSAEQGIHVTSQGEAQRPSSCPLWPDNPNEGLVGCPAPIGLFCSVQHSVQTNKTGKTF